MWECPTSAIPEELWRAVDLFWLSYGRVPGVSGMVLTQRHLLEPGSALDQDNWLHQAFEVMEQEYYAMQADATTDKQHAANLAASHANLSRATK